MIRKFLEKDFDDIYKLMRDFYDSPAVLSDISDEIITRNIENSINSSPYVEGFVFEENDEILGYGMISKSYSSEYGGLCIWFEDIYLKPSHTGKGIGSKFFVFVENLYKDAAVRFRLEVEENNTQAINLYEKCNFKRLEYVEMTKSID